MNNKRAFYVVIFSLFLFSLPAINLLDIFPDFLGYFLLAALLSRGAAFVPYLSEAKSAAIKLGFVTLARIPATVIMYANMYTGRDIVPLFTLGFAVAEAILLYILISNAFSGLFYIAERTDASAILGKTKLLWFTVTPEGVRNFTFVFALVRCAFNVLPELCLLSNQSASLSQTNAILYPILLSLCLVISFIVGIIWLVLSFKYTSGICRGVEIKDEIHKMAGEEKLASIKQKKATRQLTGTLLVLSCSIVFIFDITLNETGGINILPHFIYGLFLLYCAIRLFDSRKIKIALASLTAGFTVFGLLAHVFTVNFYNTYTLLELLERGEAKLAYLPIEIFSLFEGLLLIGMAALAAIGMRGFLLKHTGIPKDSENYSRADYDRHRSLIIRGYVLFSGVGLISALKVLKVFIDADVKAIFSHTGIIVTSSMPWLLWVVIALSILLTIYSFFYLSTVRAEVNFKYATDEECNQRGRFE